MADYISCTTTNYFQVTSEQELRELVSRIDCNDEIEIATSKEKGKTYYSLCAYGSFMGLEDGEDCKGAKKIAKSCKKNGNSLKQKTSKK